MSTLSDKTHMFFTAASDIMKKYSLKSYYFENINFVYLPIHMQWQH